MHYVHTNLFSGLRTGWPRALIPKESLFRSLEEIKARHTPPHQFMPCHFSEADIATFVEVHRGSIWDDERNRLYSDADEPLVVTL